MCRYQSRVPLLGTILICLILSPGERVVGSTLFETIERAESYSMLLKTMMAVGLSYWVERVMLKSPLLPCKL